MERGWLTPDSVPSGLRNCVLSFPDSEEFHSLIRGALFLLSQDENWEQFGSLNPAETADLFRDMLVRFFDEDCIMFPVGACIDWPSNTIPSGWLDTNQAAISRTTYAALFAVIGTTWGAGDGSTTFDLPHKDGRVTVGKKAGDSDFDTLGENGGSKVHTLTIAEMPAHDHNVSVKSGAAGGTTRIDYVTNSGSGANQITNAAQTRGGGGSHPNLQPYVIMNYIIKF